MIASVRLELGDAGVHSHFLVRAVETVGEHSGNHPRGILALARSSLSLEQGDAVMHSHPLARVVEMAVGYAVRWSRGTPIQGLSRWGHRRGSHATVVAPLPR